MPKGQYARRPPTERGNGWRLYCRSCHGWLVERNERGELIDVRPNATRASQPWAGDWWTERDARVGIDYPLFGGPVEWPDDGGLDRRIAAGARPGDEIVILQIGCHCGSKWTIETIQYLEYDHDDVRELGRNDTQVTYGPPVPPHPDTVLDLDTIDWASVVED